MVRTQIQLTEEQHRGLLRWSQRLGISLSEAVRRCVEERLTREAVAPTPQELLRAALEVCGKYSDPDGGDADGRSRVALDHDRYLTDAFGP